MSDIPGTSHASMPGLSHLPSSTFSSVDTSELLQFRQQVQYQIMQLQRWFQEVKNAYTLEKNRSESTFQNIEATKKQAKELETRLVNLQKIIAKHADDTRKIQKDVSDKNAALMALIEGMKEEIVQIKATSQSLATQIEILRTSPSNTGASAISLPDNLSQMFEALERQLGMYDVKLAEMDLRFQVLETTNYDGKLVWKIRDFDRRKEDAKRGRALSIYSQPFYTSKYGYKMCLRVYLNGDGMGKNSHISLFFVLMKGEYDGLLPFPFRQKVTLMLLDQSTERRHLSDVFRPDPTSSSFKKPTTDMNIASGCPMFVSHDTLQRGSYLKDDTIFIRVVVDTTDLDNY